MNQQPTQFNRFRVMSALALAVLGVYLVVLFNIQVVHHDDYLAQSTQAIARVEDVKASRGIITDRSGRTLVSNQYTYSLTFDTSLLKNKADQNEAILRLVQLCREQNVEWVDNLPVSQSTPAAFTLSAAGTRRTTPNTSNFMAAHSAMQPSATASIPFQVLLNTRRVLASSMEAA